MAGVAGIALFAEDGLGYPNTLLFHHPRFTHFGSGLLVVFSRFFRSGKTLKEDL